MIIIPSIAVIAAASAFAQGMMGGGHGIGMGWFGMFTYLLLTIVVIVAIVLIVRWVTTSGGKKS